MTVSFWQQSVRASDLSCDIAVIGGGIIGVSTAYWLHRLRPALKIALLEADLLAAGASGRNAGFLLQGTATNYHTDIARYGPDRARRLWHFTRENRALIGSELDRRAIQLEESGSLTVAGSAEEDARLQESVPLMRADGLPVAYLPAREINRRIYGRGFKGGLFIPTGAMLHPARLVRGIASASKATVLEHHRALSLEAAPAGVRVETTQRVVVAGQVVLALNAYLPKLVPALSRYVRPVRAQMFSTEPQATRWLHTPVYTHEGYFYLRQTVAGHLLLGGARHLHEAEEIGYNDTTTRELQADLQAYLDTHFPRSQGASVRHRWSGLMGFSQDSLPALGGVPGVEGSYWAAGFTGHGMGYGFRFGKLLAEVTLGDVRPEGLDLFTAARFEGEPSRG